MYFANFAIRKPFKSTPYGLFLEFSVWIYLLQTFQGFACFVRTHSRLLSFSPRSFQIVTGTIFFLKSPLAHTRHSALMLTHMKVKTSLAPLILCLPSFLGILSSCSFGQSLACKCRSTRTSPMFHFDYHGQTL